MKNLVLSIFPGIDLLGRAFEEEGFCVVRGPDVIWGGDIKVFHSPSGIFEGIIGGPPCQKFSRLRWLNPLAGERHGDLIPDFCRVVYESQPCWWLMENVKEAPPPEVKGYMVQQFDLDNLWVGGIAPRQRRFWFGTRDGERIVPEEVIFQCSNPSNAVILAGHGPVGRGKGFIKQIPLIECYRLMGLPDDFLEDSPFTSHGKRELIGNGVPLSMGRAIAKAVKKALKLKITHSTNK